MSVSIDIFSVSVDRLELTDFWGYDPQGDGIPLRTGFSRTMHEPPAAADMTRQSSGATG
jgi:hypothetical protein